MTFIRLVQIFTISIITILMLLALSYKQLFQLSVETKALEIANLVKAGLTSHMKAGIMSKREYFLNEIIRLQDINSLHIIRSSNILKQFGNSTLKQELNDLNLEDKIINTEPNFTWDYNEKKVQALVPYIASSKEQLNCLECHNAQENDVLGAISLEIDINQSQSIMLKYTYIIIAFLLFIALLILFNMFNFIERYLSRPLANIISSGEEAYQSHKQIQSEEYEIKEMEQLAENINHFTGDVIAREKALERKNDELSKLNEEIELTLEETIMAMGNMEELRSEDTKFHTLRVSKLSALIAKEYGLSDEDIKLIQFASPLHDIGKVGIADSILLKPAKLTTQEYEIMKTHAVLGYDVLKHSQRSILNTASIIAYSHHEKYDGSGYPQGLSGDDIPQCARIVAIVDVLDALASKRIYKEAWNIESIESLLREESGKAFEPRLVEIVLDNLFEYIDLIHQYTDEAK